MVKFVSKFNQETTTSMNKFQLKKMKWLFIVLSAILVFLGAIMIIPIEGEESEIGTGVFYIVFGILLYPLTILLTKLLQKNVNKSMNILSEDTVETYEFTENEVKIETVKGDSYRGTVQAKYDYFYKVCENETSYFFYISKMQCHVVQKKYLVEGNLNELHDIISQNFKTEKVKGQAIIYTREK